MELKTVGYFKEMSQGRETDGSIYDSVGKGNPDETEKICQYLDSGIEFVVSPGKTYDVINPENGTAGISSSYSDGVWLWPGDLAYYVRKYNVKLPEEFISAMRDSNWIVPVKLDDMNYDEIVIDGIKMT
ncbi:MAG: hypothetical protein K5678_00790 [Acetatifactor sp.]|nr:hypothetical protein [Acetatifactor sp.]